MSGRLRSLLERLASAGIDMDADTVLDALWLAVRIAERTPEPAARPEAPEPVVMPATPAQPEPARPPPISGTEPTPAPMPQTARPAARPAAERVLSVPTSAGASAAESGTAIRFRAATALANAREIERGVRPLRVTVPSPGRGELDIEATVLRAAEEEIWLPVVRPTQERWLDLVLVADASASMVVWRDTVHALRRSFERCGAFRRVQLAWLASEGGKPRVHASGRGGSAGPEIRPGRVASEPRRSFVLVVSDCIARGWHDGSVPELLRTWSRHGPVALLHTLPRHLWSRTALADTVPARLRAATGGVTNNRLQWAAEMPGLIDDVSFVLPVASLTEDSVHRLARLIAGAGGSAQGVLFEDLREVFGDGVAAAPAVEPDAERRVEWFRALASGPALRLASAFAASPVTTVRVLRLLREDLIPGGDPSHEAEVLIGGILRVHSAGDLLGATTDDVELEFVEGVRSLLLDGITAGDALRSLERAAEYAATAGRDTTTFMALIREPASHAGAVDPDEARADPFMSVSSDVLQRLGGAWARTVRAPTHVEVQEQVAQTHVDSEHAFAELARTPGVHWEGAGAGVHFTLFSENATAVRLELFDDPRAERATRTIMLERTAEDLWHTYVPGLAPGQLYGYRVDGPFEPRRGHRFDPARLLLDPYARAIAGRVLPDNERHSLSAEDPRDSAAVMPKCVVADPRFDWQGDAPPGTPWDSTVIYEAHVRGMTMRHPGVPEELRGTFLGLATEPAIEHLLSLNVTAVQLMPVQFSVDEPFLLQRGLRNYWGYSTIGFFAPDGRFATGTRGEQVREFREMVRALHAAGLEVILDVSYGHTGEGNHLGPTLSMRGIDNAAYYRLDRSDPSYYVDFTGTGNTLNLAHPRVLQLVLDSLRYWADEMRVDGFRFNLATTLARGEAGRVSEQSAFFESIRRDPVLSSVKLIAEPWDVGEGGYRLGDFPPGWAEWNLRYRDCARRYWAGMEGQALEMAHRITGSVDLFGAREDPRSPHVSINYVTSHDGFTLHDLVSYQHKHNEANGEDNRDGADMNESRNWGQEGPTEDPRILEMRRRAMKNFLATLAFSRGVPMISHGDEIARTQRGNNNAYAQDNEITWLDWELQDWQREILEFTRQAFALRRRIGTLNDPAVLSGPPAEERNFQLAWIWPDGRIMHDRHWNQPYVPSFGMLMARALDDPRMLPDALLLLMCNAEEGMPFALPRPLMGRPCVVEIDTARHGPGPHTETGLRSYDLVGFSLALLRFPGDADKVGQLIREPERRSSKR